MSKATFDIRNFVDRLAPAKEKGRYICPICKGNNLTFSAETGKYQCWNGCKCRDIQEAVAPWKEQKPKQKPIRSKSDRTWVYTNASGEPLIRTRRIDDGRGKRQLWQEYWHDGKFTAKASEDVKRSASESIVPYRYQEILEAITEGKTVFWVEGEPCADALWALGIPATTTIGGSSGYTRGNYAGLFESADLVICPDRDEAGLKYAQAIAADYQNARWLYSFPDSLQWQQLPKTGGVDIADWIESGATAEMILAAIEPAKREIGGDVQLTDQNELEFPIEFDRQGNSKVPKPSVAANCLAWRYRNQLAYDIESESFYRYGSDGFDGVWVREEEILIQKMLQEEINATGAGYGAEYISSTLKLLKGLLAVKKWDEATGLIPLQNGILDLVSGRLLPHSPGYRLKWQLPYNYDPTATCESIQDWLLESQDGDPQRVQLLRAYLKAIVMGRTDLQRFIELIGPGGTGKSTYARLAIALIGLQNTFITELNQLEANRFEVAGIHGKRLVLIADSERYAGNVTVLKSLTGQDPLRYEQKYKQAQNGFIPNALVIVAANEAIASADYTSGLERRRLTVPFLKTIAPENRRDLLTINNFGVSGEFVPYLPGLLNWVLELPDHQMVDLIRNTAQSVPSLERWKAESLIATNPIADWLDESCVFAPGVRVQVGSAEKERVSVGEIGNSTSFERYRNEDTWLYANYRAFCDRVGSRAISLKRFSDLLLDLCQNQLKHPEIQKGRDRNGAHFIGIELRSANSSAARPISGGGDGAISEAKRPSEAEPPKVQTQLEPIAEAELPTLDEVWAVLSPEQRGLVDRLLCFWEEHLNTRNDLELAIGLRRNEQTYGEAVYLTAWEQLDLNESGREFKARAKKALVNHREQLILQLAS
jgi:putative DNA primase/helicase